MFLPGHCIIANVVGSGEREGVLAQLRIRPCRDFSPTKTRGLVAPGMDGFLCHPRA